MLVRRKESAVRFKSYDIQLGKVDGFLHYTLFGTECNIKSLIGNINEWLSRRI